jgi:two-component system phosphate regulon sensor histidine kinase PhoR
MNSRAVRPETEWLIQDRLLALLRHEQRFGVALRLLLLLMLPVVWLFGSSHLPAIALFFFVIGLFSLSLMEWWALQRVGQLQSIFTRKWVALGFATNLLLIVLILLADSEPQSDWYLLFTPLAINSIFVYDQWTQSRFIPFGFIPIYALALLLHRGDWTIWVEAFFLRRVAFLLLLALLTLVVARQLHEARELARQRLLRLGRLQADLDTRRRVLTNTATNLANRVLELRSLQEGIKAINASLELKTLLELVVRNVSEVFGDASSAIGLCESDGTLRVAAHSLGGESNSQIKFYFFEELAAEVIAQDEAMLKDEVLEGEDQRRSMMAVPMVVDGESIGTLIAARIGYFPFTANDQERLNSFADQAALAVKNSRLYEKVGQLLQQVKERSILLKTVLDSIGDVVIVTGANREVLLTNAVANLIFDLPDNPTDTVVLPQEVLNSGFLEHLDSTLNNETGDPVLGELTVRGPLLAPRSYQAYSAALPDSDGHPRRVVTVLRDITATKELQQLKSNFLSTVSHELKTPLHSIKGFVNIILAEKASTGPLTEIQRDFLSTVRNQSNRLERMILDLLEFSKLESGQIKLKLQPINLTSLSEAIIEQLRPVADEGEVKLLSLIEEELALEGDRFRIEQVFHNLIANAIKFTPSAGQVIVTGSLTPTMVQITVRDTGIGIPEEEQERIFERFYQVDDAQTRRYDGTGLGLAICKHIIERHGGSIWVESKLGEGSAFHFTLPQELGAGTSLTIDFSFSS